MILFSKLATLAAWLLIAFNWLTPIEGYYNLLHWTGIGLGIAHIIEAIVFLPKAKKAGGSLPLHLVQLIIFGYPHAMQLDKALSRQPQVKSDQK